jgi:hypothetical protein
MDYWYAWKPRRGRWSKIHRIGRSDIYTRCGLKLDDNPQDYASGDYAGNVSARLPDSAGYRCRRCMKITGVEE